MDALKRGVVLFVLCALCTGAAFCASMDQRVRKVPAAVAERVSADPDAALPDVVKSLTGGVSTQAARIKVLHDWICDNIAYDTSAPPGAQDWRSVLKAGRALAEGYANLMTELCARAGMEAVTIPGWSKGFGYTGSLGSTPDHYWNAVKIGTRWQLLDVTWDAGFVEGRTFVKHYSSDWLNLAAEQFIYSHFPAEEEHQHLQAPRTAQEFVAEPYVSASFFAYGLSLGTDIPSYMNRIGGATRWDFRLIRTDVTVRTAVYDRTLFDRTGQVRYVDGAGWSERFANRVAVTFDVPDAGRTYRAQVFARQASASRAPVRFDRGRFEGSVLAAAAAQVRQRKATQAEYDLLAASYTLAEENDCYYFVEDAFDAARNAAVSKLLALAGAEDGGEDLVFYCDLTAAAGYAGFGTARRFPEQHSYFPRTLNTRLAGGLSGTLRRGGTVTLAVESRDYAGFGLLVDGELVPFVRDPQTGAYELEYTVPRKLPALVVYGTKNGRQYISLWEYQVQ